MCKYIFIEVHIVGLLYLSNYKELSLAKNLNPTMSISISPVPLLQLSNQVYKLF